MEKNVQNKVKIIAIIFIIAVILLVVYLLNGKTDDQAMIDLTGKTYYEATFYAEQYGLNLEVSYQTDTKNNGTIVSQSIKEGTIVAEGDTLKIVISGTQP